MARSVTYSVVPRRNPSEKGTPPKFYAQAQARGDVSLREMAERIQTSCTVHKSDVYAVLVALEDVVADAIQNGEIVRLGDLCTLQVSLSGKGALSEEEYTTDLIKRAKINFRPGAVLANALVSLSYSKVRVKYTKEEASGEGEEDTSGDEEA
ncbi:MAG: HU family DNA-binding protein [Bacteroidaceae bacterium]|nr:HU family DNA-binding protein [Bacteroidaceae bacterium]